MEASCPWSGFDPATMSFCEERLCAWIVEPSNTWSNLAYIAIGLAILWLERNRVWHPLRTIGYTAILVGIGSFAFHATGTFWGEFLDVSAMFLISGQFIVFNIARFKRYSDQALVIGYVLMSVLFMTMLALFRELGIAFFALQLVVAGILEIKLFLAHGKQTKYKNLLLMSGFFVVSFIIWRGDITKRWCDPHNHIFSGHAAWHVINSFCLLFFYKFHTQFYRQRNS